MVKLVGNRREQTLSKVLNLKGVGALALGDLRMSVKKGYNYDRSFRRTEVAQ